MARTLRWTSKPSSSGVNGSEMCSLSITRTTLCKLADRTPSCRSAKPTSCAASITLSSARIDSSVASRKGRSWSSSKSSISATQPPWKGSSNSTSLQGEPFGAICGVVTITSPISVTSTRRSTIVSILWFQPLESTLSVLRGCGLSFQPPESTLSVLRGCGLS
ncbi:unnamed protein product [Haemonchus placei]|uniref:Ig-like domain-containing protein n=1 Tax=Haemonchus placei TaxID=6290 RepID=A0A0N4WEX0_HAEPC|nr:unnamed protein product [Haemonchus placei]